MQPIDFSSKKAFKRESTMTRFHPSGTASKIITNKTITKNQIASNKKVGGTNKLTSLGHII